MATKIKRTKTRNRYPISLKRKIAKSYLTGEASYAVLAKEGCGGNEGQVEGLPSGIYIGNLEGKGLSLPSQKLVITK